MIRAIRPTATSANILATDSVAGEHFAALIMQAARVLPNVEPGCDLLRFLPSTVTIENLAGLAQAANEFETLQATLAEKQSPLYLTFEDDDGDNSGNEIDWLPEERQPDADDVPDVL